MKTNSLSRILGLVLALALVLGTSSAFALPSGTSAIEGLPEMPVVPTMVTSAKDTEYTITLSEKLKELSYVENMQWTPITFSEDGLTASFSTADLPAQIGYTTKESTDKQVWSNWNPNMDASDAYDRWTDAWGSYADPPKSGHYHGYYTEIGMGYGPGYYIAVPTRIWREEWTDEETGEHYNYYEFDYDNDYVLSDEEDEELLEKLDAKLEAARKVLIDKYTKLGDKAAVEAIADMGGVFFCEDGIVREAGRYVNQHFYTSRQKDDFAFDGETADGIHVRYGRYGECVQIAVEMTGVNFLGTDKTPVKTTVFWRPLEHYGKNVSNYYINNITEEYEDGSMLEVEFSSSMGGKRLKATETPAE